MTNETRSLAEQLQDHLPDNLLPVLDELERKAADAEALAVASVSDPERRLAILEDAIRVMLEAKLHVEASRTGAAAWISHPRWDETLKTLWDLGFEKANAHLTKAARANRE